MHSYDFRKILYLFVIFVVVYLELWVILVIMLLNLSTLKYSTGNRLPVHHFLRVINLLFQKILLKYIFRRRLSSNNGYWNNGWWYIDSLFETKCPKYCYLCCLGGISIRFGHIWWNVSSMSNTTILWTRIVES